LQAWINPGDFLAGFVLLVLISAFTVWHRLTPPKRGEPTLYHEDATKYRIECQAAGCANFSNGSGLCNACTKKGA
jgi:hypothetical protein